MSMYIQSHAWTLWLAVFSSVGSAPIYIYIYMYKIMCVYIYIYVCIVLSCIYIYIHKYIHMIHIQFHV